MAINKSYFENKSGIEIGGPSAIFSSLLPIYPIVRNLDGCNFSAHTIWEGNITEGNSYQYYGDKKGTQYICGADDLSGIASETYDFLLSSHCLEHCANALKTVEEWLRVIKKGGALLLVLPDQLYTFDHKRRITTFEHLLCDAKNNIDETDLTHLDEILSLHDLSMDLPSGSMEQFKARSLDNYNNRCLHHHVFDFALLREIFQHFNLKVMGTSFAQCQQIILGVKQ